MNENKLSSIKRIRKTTDLKSDILIAEYQRLSELKKVAIEEFNRRFDIYLTVFSAAIAGIIAIQQFTSGTLQAQLIMAIVVFMLALGWNVFTSLGSANIWNIHIERAIRLIQMKYIKREPQLREYFYFHNKFRAIIGTKFSILIIRGITTGGQKSIVILANSVALTYLAYIIFNSIGVFQAFLPWFRITVLIVTFLIANLLHVFYSWWFYQANGIQ